jgi:HEAT repeat protein
MKNSEELSAESSGKAAEVIQSFLKAKKNLRLYPSNNPVYIKTVKEAYGKLEEFFDHEGSLRLRITRNEIFIGLDPVYQSSGKEDNLALFFFRDGLREISFDKGVDEREFQEFMEIISVDFDQEDVEDDIVTLLWSKEFQNIKYTVDDTFLVEDENYEDEAVSQAKQDACTEDNLKQAYEEASRFGEKHSVKFMPVTNSDMEALVKMIEKDHLSKNRKLTNILLDLLRLARDDEEYKELAQIMNNAVDFFIENRDLKSAVEIIKRARIFADEAPSAEIKKCLNVVTTHAASSELIARVGDIIDSAEKFDEQVFKEFLILLSSSAIGPFISLIGEMRTVSGKKRVATALARLGRHDIATLAKGLRDKRPFVVRIIIQVLRSIRDRNAVDFLIKVARHEDPGVKKDLLLALGELGGDVAAGTVKNFLDDPSESVRTTAAKALAAIGSEYAGKVLMERVSDKKILQAEFDEMKSYFEALARLKNSTVTDMMVKILKRRAIFKRAKYTELKACALHCLGLMRSEESLEIIEELSASGNRLLGEYARTALKRMGNGK